MLQQFTVENFKSYRTSTLKLAPFTLLVGTNGSGKSNALEALALLSWAARGARLCDLRGAVRVGAIRMRGHATELLHAVDDPILRLHAVVQPPAPLGRLELELALEVDADGLRVVYERMSAPDEDAATPLYEVLTAACQGPGLAVCYNDFECGGHRPTITCTNSQPVFTQLLTPARFAQGHVKSSTLIPAAAEAMRAALAEVLFLDPEPGQMRDSAYGHPSALLADGSNVSGVLYRLCHEGYGQLTGPEGKAAVLAFVSNLAEHEITDIQFLESARGEVMMALVESFPTRPNAETIPAALLSDGTLRVLAIASALLSVDREALVVIEEIDNGVHPSRAAALVASILEVARRRDLRVLVTTHNPALLDAVPDSAIADVTACYRDPSSGASELVRLGDRDDFVGLAMRGSLGGLMTAGELERVLKRVPIQPPAAGFSAWVETLEDGT